MGNSEAILYYIMLCSQPCTGWFVLALSTDSDNYAGLFSPLLKTNVMGTTTKRNTTKLLLLAEFVKIQEKNTVNEREI